MAWSSSVGAALFAWLAVLPGADSLSLRGVQAQSAEEELKFQELKRQVNVAWYYINLPGSTDRRGWMEYQAKRLNLDFTRIEGVNAKALPEAELSQLVPCLDRSGWDGTKSQFLSQLKAFDTYMDSHAYENYTRRDIEDRLRLNKNDWLAVLEDDAELPLNIMQAVHQILYVRPDADVIYMDTRNGRNLYSVLPPKSGMSLVLYRAPVVADMRIEMSGAIPRSYMATYATDSPQTIVDDPHCLHDWFNANLLADMEVSVACNGVVGQGHQGFESTIDPAENKAKQMLVEQQLARPKDEDDDRELMHLEESMRAKYNPPKSWPVGFGPNA